MSNAQIEQIKLRIDVAELVGGYVKLHKAGINLKGLCPFHNEKTPSFFVSPTRQTWHCFGCNKGGDIFTFLQEVEGIEFAEALRILAARAGVELVRESREEQDSRTRLFEANALAAKFFEVQLEKSAKGKAALQYLEKRGLGKETIQQFQLGWAPKQPQALSDFLRSRGFSSLEIKNAGLLLEDRGHGAKDRFRGRIMFPIFDGSNRAVGFTGRIFGREEGEYDPKYLNSPETAVFEKSKILYGLNAARKAIRKEGKAVLVEGQMDCLMAHQAGTANAVATSGTALTAQHVTTLSRLADTLVVAYDADAAGIEAGKRAIELGLEGELSVRLAIVPQGKDPADLIAQDPKQWKQLIEEGTQPIVGFLIDQAVKKYGTESIEGKRSIVKDVLAMIARIGNPTDRANWIEYLRRAARLPQSTSTETLLSEELAKLKIKVSAPEKGQENVLANRPRSRRDILEEHFIALVLARGSAPKDINTEAMFSSHVNRGLYLAVAAAIDADLQDRLASFRKAAIEETVAERLAFVVERLIETILDLDGEIISCIREIEAMNTRERLDAISVELEAAERVGDTIRVRDLAEEFRQNSAKLALLFSEKTASSI